MAASTARLQMVPSAVKTLYAPHMDSTKRTRRREALIGRAARMAVPDAGFLHVEAARIIGERLAVTNRRFEKPVLLFDGPFAEMIGKAVMEAGAPVDAPFQPVPWPDVRNDTEILPLEPESVDLVISVFDLQRMADLATRAGVEGHGPRIESPLSGMTKPDIIRLGLKLGVDYPLTHSCYDPSNTGTPCARCDSCRIRKAAFAQLGMQDPALTG